ncbi:MAG: hypothetical protein IT207_01580 [Fimbriimonadaceae bacterium]|nr:hypothetical protein [Fimbriimonadaceae bacterium]
MSNRLRWILGSLAVCASLTYAQSNSDFEPGTLETETHGWGSTAPNTPPVKRPAIELARSRITTVWLDKPWEVPSAQSLATGIVSEPRDEVKEELDEEARRKREAGKGRTYDHEPSSSRGRGWLSLVDLYSHSTLDEEDATTLNPDPAPEPGTLVVFGAPLAWAFLRRRGRSRVNPHSAGSDALMGIPAKDRRGH